jgi:poly-beta-1,6-N-acetyl-D-glucosamine synthase
MRKSTVKHAIVAAMCLAAASGHVVYPAWLTVASMRRRPTVPPVPRSWPGLSVVIAAYREAAVIGDKVRSTKQDPYPGDVEILVVADDEETADAAEAAGATVLRSEARTGQGASIARGIASARHEIVVLSDANTVFRTGSLRALARWFDDPAVGAVAGRKTVLGGHEGLYWRFESYLKKRETRLGSTVGLVMEIAAIRRSALPLPRGDIVLPDLWIALDVIEGGKRVVYEPEAVSAEEPPLTLREDWERRTRIVSGCLQLLGLRRQLLDPSAGILAVQLWGHKLVRYSVAPVAHLMLVAAAVLMYRSNAAKIFLLAHGLAALGWVADVKRWHMPRWIRAIGQVLYLQIVALGGIVRWRSGDLAAMWPKANRNQPIGDGLSSRSDIDGRHPKSVD